MVGSLPRVIDWCYSQYLSGDTETAKCEERVRWLCLSVEKSTCSCGRERVSLCAESVCHCQHLIFQLRDRVLKSL